MSVLSVEDRILGMFLGLGDLAGQDGPHHHGYQNGCICEPCLERDQRPTEPRPAASQPWEPRLPKPSGERPAAN